MTPRDKAAVERIIACLDKIDGYVARTGPDWADDDMAVDAVAKRIEEIGEFAKRLSAEALESMVEVDWRGVIGARDVMAHDYDEIDTAILADTVRDDLPVLRAAATRWLG